MAYPIPVVLLPHRFISHMSGASSAGNMGNGEIDFESDAFQTALERAVRTNEGIDNLDKAETIYYVSAVLTGDMPEDHPDDHNGNVARSRLKEWAKELADRESSEG